MFIFFWISKDHPLCRQGFSWSLLGQKSSLSDKRIGVEACSGSRVLTQETPGLVVVKTDRKGLN